MVRQKCCECGGEKEVALLLPAELVGGVCTSGRAQTVQRLCAAFVLLSASCDRLSAAPVLTTGALLLPFTILCAEAETC